MSELTATIQVYALSATIQTASLTASILPGGLSADVAPQSFTANIAAYNITASVTAGIRGIDGLPGSAAEEISGTAGENLSALRVVRAKAGGIFYCDSSDTADADTAIGITSAAASLGATVTIRAFGEMSDNSWDWEMGKPVYFTSTGALTQTPPATGFAQIIAVPASATKINITLRNAIQLT